MLPMTSKAAPGAVVPMPTLPLFRIVIASVAPLLPTRKCMSAPVAPTPEVVWRDRSEVVPVPPMSSGLVTEVENAPVVAPVKASDIDRVVTPERAPARVSDVPEATPISGVVKLGLSRKAIVFLLVEGLKYKLVPSYSIAPASAVVRLVPDVNLSGAVLAAAVPALRCKTAVGLVVPMPTLPAFVILIHSLLVPAL